MYLQLISLLTVLLPYPKKDLSKPLEILPKIKKPTAQDCVDSRLRAGKCILLSQCPDIIEEFYDAARVSTYDINFQTFISSSICGVDEGKFLICCKTPILYPITMTRPPVQIQNNQQFFVSTGKPLYETYQKTTPFLFAPLSGNVPQTIATVSNNLPPAFFQNSNSGSSTPNIFVYNPYPSIVQTTSQPTLISQQVHQPPFITDDMQTCGVNHGTINRVVGGSEAGKGNYPWVAALGYRDDYDPGAVKFLCAGSLISSTYVITSAHCINNSLWVVRLGAHDINNKAEPSAKNYHIKRTAVHEKFDLKNIANDLALIELSATVAMTKFITTICLPDEPKFLAQEFVGMHPFVVGWGAKQYQGPTSNVLRDAQVPIVSRQVCEQSYRTIFNFVKVTEMLICAGDSYADSCQGDSGGPLMLPQLLDSSYHYYLIGVVSFGYECARVGFPGVYTKVAAYIPWIKDNMK